MRRILNIIFFTICLIITFSIINQCAIKYFNDSSYTSVRYEEIPSNTNRYPSISICFMKPLIRAELLKFNQTKSSYYHGNLTELNTIPYDKISISINKSGVDFNSNIQTKDNKYLRNIPVHLNSVVRSISRKCYTVDPLTSGAKINKWKIR